MERVKPNPYSPYADADPQYRHIIPSFLGILPQAGSLVLAACGGMTVVPEEALRDAAGEPELPPGLCSACLAVMAGDEPERPQEAEKCRRCESGSSHGDLCAFCRQEGHAKWWPIAQAAGGNGS